MERQVLFICVRNRIRSVFAEFYLRQKLAEKIGPIAEKIKIFSAGLYPKALKKILDEGGIVPPDPFFDTDMSVIVRQRLREKGIYAPDQWRSKPLTPDLAIASDLIVVALPWQKEEIAEEYPQVHERVFTFKEMASWEDNILFETIEGLPMDESFWDACEEDAPYVTKVIDEVENLMDIGFPKMLKQLGLESETIQNRSN